MSDVLGNLAATVTMNIDPFQQSSRVLQSQMRDLDRQLKLQESAFKNSGNGLQSQKAQYMLTGKSIETYSAQLKNETEHYEKLKAEIGDVSKATVDQKTDLLNAEAAVAKTTGKINELTGSYKKLGTEIAISESNWTKAGQTLEKVGNGTKAAGDKLQGIGSTMTSKVTMPIVAGVAAVTAAAISWESSFAGVTKTNDEVVDANGKVVYSYKDLENGLRDLAKQLPASHQEIAAVAEAAGQLGIKTENVKSFTKVMIDMGESTNLSAETAATELARFANITGMSQDKFSNLGSAIVDLGNKFATTESEISAMALRLAGAGSQVGMSEGDILGLAAALSSVGIEAEAGGSAFSKVLVNMQLAVENGMGAFDELIDMGKNVGVSFNDINTAVQDGGKNLTALAKKMGLSSSQLKKMYKEADTAATTLVNFSDVAGMTNAEFGELFKSNPAEALQKFIQGLGHAEEKGTSAIKVLDDMDITEVRLRDSLLRAANASGIFGDAVATGNKAFGENTALATEAEKRYATVESQLKMLKNEVVDVAIEFGGPFLQALRDGLKAAKPFIKTLTDIAKKFSEASPETQQQIIKIIGLTAALGPATKILGTFMSITGGGISKIGGLAKKIGELSGKAAASKATMKVAEEAMKAAGTGATVAIGGAGSGVTGLAAGLGALAAPAAIAVGALALVAGAVVVGKKAYDEYQLSGGKWGVAVTEEQDKVISKSYELKEKAGDAINNYQDGVTSSSKKVVQANKDIVDSIQKTIDKENSRKEKKIAKIDDEDTKKAAENQLDWDKKVQEIRLNNVKAATEKINKIMTDASDQKRKLSAEETQIITQLYSKMSKEELEAIGYTKKQAEEIEMRYQDNLVSKTYSTNMKRRKAVEESLGQTEKWYQGQKKAIESAFANDPGELKEKLNNLDNQYKVKTENMVTSLAKLYKATGSTIKDMGVVWSEYGYTVEEVEKLVDKSATSTTKNVEMFAKATNDAATTWNALAIDPKTGEIKNNMAETLVEIAKTDEGWSELEFMTKNADISSNAKEEVAIAMGLADKWNLMSMPDKLVTVDNEGAMVKLYDTIDQLNMWNQYNADRKVMGIDNADAMYKFFESIGALDDYNAMDVPLKTLLAEGPAKMTYDEAKEALRQYNELPEELKTLLADNTSVQTQIAGASEIIRAYNQNMQPDEKKLTITTNAWDIASSANAALNTVKSQTRYLQVKMENIMESRDPKFAQGTNYHKGGLAVLGDGGRHEPFLTPKGHLGVSPNVDTLMNLPRGTKVWSSIGKFINQLPKFAGGTKFDDTNLSRFKFAEAPRTSNPFAQIISQLKNSNNGDADSGLINAILALASRPVVLSIDGKQFVAATIDDFSGALDKRAGASAGSAGFRRM